MMMDVETNATYNRWQKSWEAWMLRHLGLLPYDVAHKGKNGPVNHTVHVVNQIVTPSDWSGLAVWDMEGFGAHWNIRMKTEWGAAWQMCTPLDGNGPCTALWSTNHFAWAYFVANVSSPAFDTALLDAAGFSPPRDGCHARALCSRIC